MISLLDIESKARTKDELYKIITQKEGLFLLPYKIKSIDFIVNIMESKKSKQSRRNAHITPMLWLGFSMRWCHCQTGVSLEGTQNYRSDRILPTECDGEDYLPSKFIERPLNRHWLWSICELRGISLYRQFSKSGEI